MTIDTQPIWKLIRCCAEELTMMGKSPFTRGDLIKCVQRINPHYANSSINPIIQGITDNLRGGASGAIGKNILHSVGRGLFVLRESSPSKQKSLASIIKTKANRPISDEYSSKVNGVYVVIGGAQFQKICDIRPERAGSGSILEFMPQDRYKNTYNYPLNKNGYGPFCKFKIPTNCDLCGVYAININGKTKYIGECENLSSRYNTGYGNISPRNCFVGGQETNCRVNNLILNEAKNDAKISLWFFHTIDYKKVEHKLRIFEKPEWNLI